jgi:hypothetical protein
MKSKNGERNNVKYKKDSRNKRKKNETNPSWEKTQSKMKKNQPILITEVNKLEEKPPANPPKIVETPLKRPSQLKSMNQLQKIR